MAKQTIVRQLIEALRDKPMRFVEMRDFVWKASGREGRSQQGWWSDQFKNLQYRSEVIRKNKRTGKYELTDYGKECKRPFRMSKDKELKVLKRNVKHLESRIESLYEERRVRIMKDMRIRQLAIGDQTGLIGRTIVAVQPMSMEKMDEYHWFHRPEVLTLDNGVKIYPQRDHEGNDGGVLSFENPQGQTWFLDYAQPNAK